MTIDYEILWGRFREWQEWQMKNAVKEAGEALAEWDLDVALEYIVEAKECEMVLNQMKRHEMAADCDWRKEDGK